MPPKRRHHGRKKKQPRNKQYDNWDDYDWEDLTPELQDAARVLRWNPTMWDSDGKARTEEYDWKELSKAQRRAARAFGYNHGIWDEDLRPYKMRQKGRAMVTRRDREKFDKKHGHGSGPADSDASSSDEESDVSYSSFEEYPESDDSEAEEGEIDFEVEPEDEEPPAPPPKEEKEEEDVKVEELPAEDITQAYDEEEKENEIEQQQFEEEAKKRQEEEEKRQAEEAAAAAAEATPPPPEEEEEEEEPTPPPPVPKPTKPMFRVSKTYGKSTGGNAFDHGNNACITKIVTFSDRHCVRGLQVTYNKTHNFIAGNTKTGMAVYRKEYKLDEDGTEFIDTVRVRSNKFVQSLTFITNKGKRFGPVGGKGWKKINFMKSDTCGELVEVDAPGNEMQLCGIAGRAGKYLDAIAFRWGPTVRSSS